VERRIRSAAVRAARASLSRGPPCGCARDDARRVVRRRQRIAKQHSGARAARLPRPSRPRLAPPAFAWVGCPGDCVLAREIGVAARLLGRLTQGLRDAPVVARTHMRRRAASRARVARRLQFIVVERDGPRPSGPRTQGWTPHERGAPMNPRHYVVDLKESSRELQPTYYFMVNCLLYSRMETGLVSNQECYDEDVNVYLAHLLHSFINPEFVEQSKRFLSKYDTEVFRRLSSSTDARLRYQIHKTNADFLLVSIGLFDNPRGTGGTRRTQPSEEAYVGRGKTYYHFAYSYAQQVHRKNAGVAEVLEKLSVGFDKYIRILSHMRGEYLDLMNRLSQGEVYHLERSVDEHAQQELLRVKQDELLELYSAWKTTPDARTVEDLQRVVHEIQQLNPSFKFELPKR
jgi:hypothetical protein